MLGVSDGKNVFPSSTHGTNRRNSEKIEMNGNDKGRNKDENLQEEEKKEEELKIQRKDHLL